MRNALARTVALVLISIAVASCSPPVQETRLPAMDAVSTPFAKIALLPVRQAPDAHVAPSRPDAPPPQQPSEMLENALRVGLGQRGVVVIAPDDLASALGTTPEALAHTDADAACEQAAARHAADAVLSAEVVRFRERRGRELGAEAPASVMFRAALWRAADHALVWQSEFDETQEPISANVLNAGRYPGGGTRWLTAEELLRWGGAETAARVPLGR